MKKYNIEGNIDFYSELYKSLDIEENEHKTEEDSKLCLITKQPLIDKYFEMNCGHKFNYLPLYLDIKNHKQKYNGMESTSCQLKKDEIRCPYCRKKQTGILPYYEELGLTKINGVNIINNEIVTKLPVCGSFSHIVCQFLELNPNFDKNNNNLVNDYNEGNPKFLKCFKYGTQIDYNCLKGQYKKGNHVVDYSMPESKDKNYYCFCHKKVVIKNYKYTIVNQAKEELKNIKIKEKEELKNIKIKEKEELKKVKQIKKLDSISKKNIKNQNIDNIENIVIGVINLSENEIVNNDKSCLEILKTGIKKGECCGCNVFSDSLCKRHYNLKNKFNNNIKI